MDSDSTQSRQDAKTQPKPFGWEVDVECCDRLIYIPGSSFNTVLKLHYRGSRSAAKRRAMLKPHARAVIAMRPVTEEQWRRCYGNPEERGV